MPSPARPHPNPDRDRVLAWMAAEGKGYRLASRYFGLPEERIKNWIRADKARGSAPSTPAAPAIPTIVLPPPPPPERDRDTGRFPPRTPRVTETPIAALTASDIAALTPEARAGLRAGAIATAQYLGSLRDQMSIVLAAQRERAMLRAGGAPEDEIDARCPLPRGPDWRQVDSATRAMMNLAKIAPLIAAMDTETGGVAESDGPSAAEYDALHAALCPPGAPVLQLVPAVSRGGVG